MNRSDKKMEKAAFEKQSKKENFILAYVDGDGHDHLISGGMLDWQLEASIELVEALYKSCNAKVSSKNANNYAERIVCMLNAVVKSKEVEKANG